jgi:ABC-type Fe3+ transport system substrate-binding protein
MAVELKAPGKILIALMGVALLGYAAFKYGWLGSSRDPGGTGTPSDSRPRSGAKVTVDLLYGTEKERWLTAALDDFRKARPDIDVRVKGMGTIESIRALVDGKEKPTVWSPADEIALNLMDAEWSLAKGSSILDKEGDLAPQSLVITPLVVIAWEERAKAVEKSGTGPISDWRTLHALGTNPKGWSGIGAPAEWGFVKLGHTAPNASNSGLQALVLMAYSYHKKTAGLKPEDLLDEKFQKWMKEIETAVGKFGASSGTYMKDMVLYGPSKYDIIWNYESVAIGDMGAAQGRWGNLSVHYPNPTLWSNHPFAILKGDWVTAEQNKAAQDLRAFLLSLPVQQRALEFGFRPANPDVVVKNQDPNNPFNRLKPFGVRLDIPPVAEAPSGEVARLLLETWRRVVGSENR